MRAYDIRIPIGSVYVASKNGFGIYVDDQSATAVDPVTGEIETYDASERPWYQLAESKQRLIFTDVFEDSEGKGLAISCAAPYYDRYGDFAGVVGVGYFLTQINEIISTSKIGNNGWGFVIDQQGKVIFSAKNSGLFAASIDEKTLFDGSESLSAIVKEMVDGKTGVGTFSFEQKDYYLAYAPISHLNMSYGAVLEVNEVVAPALTTSQEIKEGTTSAVSTMESYIADVILAMLAAIAIVGIIVGFVANKLADGFIRPIHQLTDGVREISAGNLEKKLDIDTGDEIESLAVSFNAMTDELQSYMTNLTKVTAEKERIATELDVATNIQVGMLPNMFPAFPEREEFDIYATMHAAKEVGGDFYDFYLIDESHLVIKIADVSGKGVPAALFMAISKTILRNFSMSMNAPDDFESVMTLSNQQLCQNNDEMMFVIVFLGMIDLKTGNFIYVNAGHNAPLICHKNKFEYIDVGKSCMLGVDEDAEFTQQQMHLDKNDIIFLYTDGVTEAMNEQGEQYLPEHLQEVLNAEDHSEPLTTLLENIQISIKKHAGNAEQSDDITMLAVRLN